MRKVRTIVLSILLFSLNLVGQIDDAQWIDSLKSQVELSKYDKPEEVVHFNTDTILVAGNLDDLSNPDKYDRASNVVYRTVDGGVSWDTILFDGDAYIYTTEHNSIGEIWMGGSDEFMHYSNDYGKSWERRPKPFTPSDRVYAINMRDAKTGIAGGLQNGLALTFDAWVTSTPIPSPYDQKKLKLIEGSACDRIEFVGFIDSLLLVEQNKYVFYSRIDSINWRKFNIPVSTFLLEKEKGEIYLKAGGKFFVVDSNLNLIRSLEKEYTREYIAAESIELDLTEFLKYPLKSIELTGISYEYDKNSSMDYSRKEIKKVIKIVSKKRELTYKTKKYQTLDIELPIDEVEFLLSDKLCSGVDSLPYNLKFAEKDKANYLLVLEKEREKRIQQEGYCGAFIDRSDLENPAFTRSMQEFEDSIKNEHVTSYYDRTNYGFLFERTEDHFKMVIVNEKDDLIEFSNWGAFEYSLPWTINYQGKSIITYNPDITHVVRALLPESFPNYDLLLGGGLIYYLRSEQMMDEWEYKKK